MSDQSDHSKIGWTDARLDRLLREEAERFSALEQRRKVGAWSEE